MARFSVATIIADPTLVGELPSPLRPPLSLPRRDPSRVNSEVLFIVGGFDYYFLVFF